MVSRRVFSALTTGLLVLAIAALGLQACQTLLAALGDLTGARAVRMVGGGCWVALAGDSVLLLAALGFQAGQPPRESSGLRDVAQPRG